MCENCGPGEPRLNKINHQKGVGSVLVKRNAFNLLPHDDMMKHEHESIFEYFWVIIIRRYSRKEKLFGEGCEIPFPLLSPPRLLLVQAAAPTDDCSIKSCNSS